MIGSLPQVLQRRRRGGTADVQRHQATGVGALLNRDGEPLFSSERHSYFRSDEERQGLAERREPVVLCRFRKLLTTHMRPSGAALIAA